MVQVFVPNSNIGNQIFRYMSARCAQLHIDKDVEIVGHYMPEFALIGPDVTSENFIRTGQIQKIDLPSRIKHAKQQGVGVYIDGYAQRLEFFERDRDIFVEEFRRKNCVGARVTDDEIAINVRAGEVLRGIHGDMYPLPIAFYRNVISRTGLRPVFVGQLAENEYTRALRSAFPSARYFQGEHWLEDFETVRSARNVCVAISTFSWLAAWLSEQARNIVLPIAGIFNPRQRPDIDLLPMEDNRYTFLPMKVLKFDGSAGQFNELINGEYGY